MPLFESKEDAELRRKIAVEVKAEFDKKQLSIKEAKMREEERQKLESGGLMGSLVTQGKKVIKDVLK